MKTPFLLIIVLTSAVMISISCSKSKEKTSFLDCALTPKIFSDDVDFIIQTFCNQATCHDQGSVNGPGPLTNYTEVFNARDKIRVQVEAGLMPQNTTLTTAQKNTIICWIDSGAPDN